MYVAGWPQTLKNMMPYRSLELEIVALATSAAVLTGD